MERPASGQAFIVIVGLFAVVFGLLGLSLLLTYLSGSYVSATPGDAGTGMGPCVLLLMFLIPVSMLAVGVQSGQTEREYLLKFVKQVCEATPFEVPATDTGSGYTGKTHHLS
jgi:hypothetical protein